MSKLLCTMTVLVSLLAQARSITVEVSAMQVGGIHGDGAKDNLPSHQNYYVGYGSGAAPFSRPAERRSFFWYHLPTHAGPIVSAKLSLKMAFAESLIFGKGPGDPGPSVPLDELEAFRLGYTMAPAGAVTDPTLSTPLTLALFDDMDAHPIAAETTFSSSIPYSFPMTVDIFLDGAGIGLLSGASGGDVVLTGWMPTWSFDDRLAPGGGDWFEKHELLFGHSEILPGAVPNPVLTIEYAAVPEPGTLALALFGLGMFQRRRPRRVVD